MQVPTADPAARSAAWEAVTAIITRCAPAGESITEQATEVEFLIEDGTVIEVEATDNSDEGTISDAWWTADLDDGSAFPDDETFPALTDWFQTVDRSVFFIRTTGNQQTLSLVKP